MHLGDDFEQVRNERKLRKTFIILLFGPNETSSQEAFTVESPYQPCAGFLGCCAAPGSCCSISMNVRSSLGEVVSD